MKGPAEDQEGEGVAKAEQQSGAAEGEEAEEEGKTAAGGFVGEEAADGGSGEESGAVDGEKDGHPVLNWSLISLFVSRFATGIREIGEVSYHLQNELQHD